MPQERNEIRVPINPNRHSRYMVANSALLGTPAGFTSISTPMLCQAQADAAKKAELIAKYSKKG